MTETRTKLSEAANLSAKWGPPHFTHSEIGKGMRSTVRSSLAALLVTAFFAVAALAAATFFALAPQEAADDAAANRLFIAGFKARTEAEKLSGENLSAAERRVVLLKEVVGDLRRIVEEYAGANLAVRLVAGEHVGSLSLPAAEATLEDARVTLNFAENRQQTATLPLT